jgi:hypothetical protein
MTTNKIMLHSLSDGKMAIAYCRIANAYALNPDTNTREVIQQSKSYALADGEGLNTTDDITFTSLSGQEYTIVK